MFQINDTILYGADGVCVIAEIAKRTFGGKTQEYYVLKPVYSDQATIFVPTQNEKLLAKMRRILSEDEIYDMIQGMPEDELLWIENENERKQAYGEIIRTGDRKAMVRLIKTLYLRQQDLKRNGKKFHACDERFMKDAEKILYHEFAHVLHMEPNQVQPFILSRIQAQEQEQLKAVNT